MMLEWVFRGWGERRGVRARGRNNGDRYGSRNEPLDSSFPDAGDDVDFHISRREEYNEEEDEENGPRGEAEGEEEEEEESEEERMMREMEESEALARQLMGE